MNMDIFEALNQVSERKKRYFYYKFPDLQYDEKYRKKLTKEEFLQRIGKKSLRYYERWEKTEEFRHLVTLYLQTKITEDLLSIYENTKKKALEGDEKAIKLLLQLQKEIESNKKTAIRELTKSKDEDDEEDEDDLIL